MTKNKCDKKIAFLILAHDNVEVLNIFINQLLSYEGSYIFLHLDSKSNIKDKEIIQSKRIIFVERTNCSWGDYSLVQCVLNLYKESFNHEIPFDYYSLHSGVDLAINDINNFVKYLSKNQKQAYLRCSKMPYKGWGLAGGFERIDLYYPKFFRKKMKKTSVIRLLKVIYTKSYILSHIWKFKKRDYEFYGGSFWHTVDNECVSKILEYIEDHPDYSNIFCNGLISDEIFFNTIIIKVLGVENVETNNNLRYIDWTDRTSEYSGSPKLLSIHDYDKIVSSNKFFARKFDISLDSNIIMKIINYK